VFKLACHCVRLLILKERQNLKISLQIFLLSILLNLCAVENFFYFAWLTQILAYIYVHFSALYNLQVDLWKKYIAWEKSNPLRTEDATLITRRVMFAFEQCLLCLGHHPDIWYEAAQFLEQSSKLLTEKGVSQNVPPIFSPA